MTARPTDLSGCAAQRENMLNGFRLSCGIFLLSLPGYIAPFCLVRTLKGHSAVADSYCMQLENFCCVYPFVFQLNSSVDAPA